LDAAGTIAGEMIAAQSQLAGFRQIYTDNNPRVRSLEARVASLRKQLDNLGGSEGGGARGATTADSQRGDLTAREGELPYPTIQRLPILGAKYSDYYRRAKIQETVYELLTEQFELAKVQEAKETPSVKILDLGIVPERKSFPPRSLIVFLGTFLTTSLCVLWVVGADHWNRADPQDPRKMLFQEVTATLKARTPWASRNGDGTVPVVRDSISQSDRNGSLRSETPEL
jgi:uncharacterized protein involved in exopolysaccharide biosynthesis